ncbi:MAG: NAD(P)-dependent oxidoreductase [Alphaproteobacteria bacterium]|nr:NAD(P)-dependent oxidoreductase [Alphaproteobacteria bacterium]
MASAPGHVLVTGGTGYIGSRLIETALDRGCHVTALGGRVAPAPHPRLRVVAWRLGQAVPSEAFQACDAFPPVEVVLHGAHDWDGSGGEDDPNVVGTQLLMTSARIAQARIVFLSSVSARAGALNRYGRTKWRIEQMLDRPGDVSARIGLVYGGQLRSQWGTLCRLVGLSPVLPMLDAGKPVQPIHLDDLCAALLALAQGGFAPSVCCLADPATITFGDFLRKLALARHGRRLRMVSIPAELALRGIDLAARIPGLPRIDRERVLGLMGLPVVDSAASLAALGISLRPLDQGLRLTGRDLNRRLLFEGGKLVAYVGGGATARWAARRYVRALVGAEGPAVEPLILPAVLRLADPFPDRPQQPLSRRLSLAMLVAETSREGGRRFYDFTGTNRAVLVATLTVTAMIEIACLPCRLLGRWIGRG